MDFREEYKKSEKLISPSDEQLERMMAGVMSRIEEGEPDTKALNITQSKKAFPFKKIAYIGGSIAACAAITIAAVNIAPSIGKVQTANGVSSMASFAADAAIQSEAFTTDTAATTYSEAEKVMDETDAESYDGVADLTENALDEEPAANFITANGNKSNPGAAGTTEESNSDVTNAKDSDVATVLGETAEACLESFETAEYIPPAPDDAGIITCEPCENDNPGNPETGADPDMIESWQNAVKESPLVCTEDFDSDFEKTLTRIEFTSENYNNDTLIIGDKTYKLTNQAVEDEWTITYFSMSSEEIAALPYEYFTTGHFGDYQHVYKIFFAEDRCFTVYLLDNANSFTNPHGEYVLVE